MSTSSLDVVLTTFLALTVTLVSPTAVLKINLGLFASVRSVTVAYILLLVPDPPIVSSPVPVG